MVVRRFVFLVDGEFRLAEPLGPLRLVQEVGDDSDGHRDREQDQEYPKGVLGEHRQHHERLVSGGRDHHRDQGSETDYAVRVKGYGGETAHAAGDEPQQRGDHHLAGLALPQSREKAAAGIDVQRLDEHHHYDHQPRDQHGVPERIQYEIDNHLRVILLRPPIPGRLSCL